MPQPAYGVVTYLIEYDFTIFASRGFPRRAYDPLSVTALFGMVTLTFDLLTSK